jgi:hypothetical protein
MTFLRVFIIIQMTRHNSNSNSKRFKSSVKCSFYNPKSGMLNPVKNQNNKSSSSIYGISSPDDKKLSCLKKFQELFIKYGLRDKSPIDFYNLMVKKCGTSNFYALKKSDKDHKFFNGCDFIEDEVLIQMSLELPEKNEEKPLHQRCLTELSKKFSENNLFKETSSRSFYNFLIKNGLTNLIGDKFVINGQNFDFDELIQKYENGLKTL